MTSSNQDRAEGTVDEAKGKVKEGFGDLTGDKQSKGEGMMDQAVGKVKQSVGDAKDKVSDAMDNDKNK